MLPHRQLRRVCLQKLKFWLEMVPYGTIIRGKWYRMVPLFGEKGLFLAVVYSVKPLNMGLLFLR